MRNPLYGGLTYATAGAVDLSTPIYEWMRVIAVEQQTLAHFLARRLREIRLAKGLSQREMETLGINPKYYQRIEAGTVNLTLRSIEKLALALGVGVLEIFQMNQAKVKRTRI